ncbi:hypothetical protein [Candidatus Uabimicrobium sp. HlEnr_7]|uniref:tetratricopeptide repeat protein n=1 Tax=Candidatus Uabimicrobium helgolandensis TaxID=3095367 RepID=UPI003558332B
MKKKWIFLIVIVTITVVISAKVWRDSVIVKQEKYRYHKAQQFYQEKDFRKSLIVAYTYKKILGKDKYRNSKWQHLEIKILQKLRNIPRLAFLYEQNPGLFLQYEQASIWVTRAFIESKLWKKHQKIAKQWRDKKTLTLQWFLLEIDALIKKQQQQKAREKLLSYSEKSPTHAEIWTRLALLEMEKNNLQKAWQYLENGYNYDSKNSDLRSFRGQILESLGKIKEARVEYVAAYLSDAKNPLAVDQLSEFYIRQDNYLAAINTWKNVDKNAPVYIFQKLAFYQKIAVDKKIKLDIDDDIVKTIIKLPKQIFWNKECSQIMTKHKNVYLYWLRTLNLIKNRQYDEALQWLQKNRTENFKPQLQNNLHRLLFYQKYQGFTQGGIAFLEVNDRTSCCELCHSLDDKAKRERMQLSPGNNKEMLEFIKSPNAFAAQLLCFNWLEAAVSLHQELSNDDIPEWYARRIMHAMSIVRSKESAIDFAKKYPKMTSVQLLKAEILISINNIASGLSILKNLASKEQRAAWLLSLYHLQQRKYKLAEKYLHLHKSFFTSVLGQEIQARIFIFQGNKQKAEHIYVNIATKSVEAKVFLAKEAFARRDWEEAEKWTQILQQEFPEQTKFSENMNNIIKMKNKNEE